MKKRSKKYVEAVSKVDKNKATINNINSIDENNNDEIVLFDDAFRFRIYDCNEHNISDILKPDCRCAI